MLVINIASRFLPGLKGSGSDNNCKESQADEHNCNMKLQSLFVCW